MMQSIMVFVMTMGAARPYIEPVPIDDQHRVWWTQVQECTGVQQSMEGVRIQAVNDTMIMALVRVETERYMLSAIGRYQLGLADIANRTIYVERGFEHNRKVVAHEMIHLLLGPGHPRVPFEDPCKLYFHSKAEVVQQRKTSTRR